MDDFATVIWVVIIAGAMIFNVVSQSRKARGKGARTPGHEEAWPSQAHPESEPAPMPAPRPAPWPVAPVFRTNARVWRRFPPRNTHRNIRRRKPPGGGIYAIRPSTGSWTTAGMTKSPRIPSQQCTGCGNDVPDRRIQPPAGDYLLGNTETQVRGIGCLKPSLKPP